MLHNDMTFCYVVFNKNCLNHKTRAYFKSSRIKNFDPKEWAVQKVYKIDCGTTTGDKKICSGVIIDHDRKCDF